MTRRWRSVAYAGVAVGVALSALVIPISGCAHSSSDTSASELTTIVGDIQADLTAMSTIADHYLRSGKTGDLAEYQRVSAPLPKDMNKLLQWGGEAGSPMEPKVTALLEATQDEAQIIELAVAASIHGGVTFGPALARGLDGKLPRARVSFERAKLALEDASI